MKYEISPVYCIFITLYRTRLKCKIDSSVRTRHTIGQTFCGLLAFVDFARSKLWKRSWKSWREINLFNYIDGAERVHISFLRVSKVLTCFFTMS